MFTALLIAAAGLGLHHGLPAENWSMLETPPPEVVAAAAQLGLTPRALAASGVNATQAVVLIDGLATAHDELSALAGAELAVDTAEGEVSHLWQLAELSPHDGELRDQLEQARAGLQFAREGLAAARAALLQVATAGLEGETLARLSASVARAESGLPPALRVIPITDGEVRQLRRATVAVRRAQRRGELPPPEAAAVVAAARSDLRVVEAEGWLSSRLGAIRTALGQP